MKKAAPPLAVAAVAIAVFAAIRRILAGTRTVAGAVIHTPTDETGIDHRGAVRSVQGADIVLPSDAITGLWNPEHLERLARTYWLSLYRFTFGLVRVVYTETERYVVLVHPRLRLLTFYAPEYEMDSNTGIVRWRIKKGLLVAGAGREGDGKLELRVCRFDYPDWDKVRIHVEVEVANFYPAIASSIGRWVYVNTQSRIHVIACHTFLRNLVKRELDVSPVGRFAGPQSAEEAPNPGSSNGRARQPVS